MGTHRKWDLAKRSGLLALAFLPALGPLWIVLEYGVNIPYWDQLEPDIANVLIKAKTGGLGLSDLAAQHNEHRMLVARLVFLVLGLMTGWNTRAEMVVSWLILVLTSLGLLWLIRRTMFPSERWYAGRVLFLWFLCNVLFFTPAQQENLTLGIGIANVLPFAWIVAGLLVAGSGLRFSVKVGLGILLSVVATWSSGNGVLAWVVIAMPLFLVGDVRTIREKWIPMIVWGVSAAVCMGLYYIGYTSPSHLGASSAPVGLGTIIHYVLAFLGNHFIWASPHRTTESAAIFGLFQLLLLGTCLVYLITLELRDGPAGRSLRNQMLPWLAIALFALLNAVVAGIFRANLGVVQANSSRYVIFSIQLPMALIGLISMVVSHARSGGRTGWWLQIPSALVGVVLLLQVFSYPVSLRACGVLTLQRRQGKGLVLLMKVATDTSMMARMVYPWPAKITEELAQLNDLGYINPPMVSQANATLLQPAIPAAGKVVQGGIERSGISDTHQLNIGGYSVFVQKRRAAELVFFTYTNERREPIIFAIANAVISRGDLVTERKDSMYEYSGWVLTVPMSRLAGSPPDTVIQAWALDTDTGHAYKLDGQIQRQW